MRLTSFEFQDWIAKRRENDRQRWHRERTMLLISLGACGELGEAMEHFKKVMRDYDGDFSAYPENERKEALLEFGDALNYFTRCAMEFGFTLEDIMAGNYIKLTRRDRGLEPGRKGAQPERGPCLFPSCRGQCGTDKPCQ